MRKNVLLVVVALSTAALNADLAWAQATRTWVSGVGDDANPCSRTAPCKTFAGAISKTAASGEINCLDPGGFGAVTITKSITILCDHTLGSVLAAFTNGININGSGIVVNLSGLDIEGAGSGLIGINFISGSALNISNTKIRGFNSGSGFGVLFAPNTAATLTMQDSLIYNNGAGTTGAGIQMRPAVGGSINAALTRVLAHKNVVGIRAESLVGGGAVKVTIKDSVASSSVSNGMAAIGPAGGGLVSVMIESSAASNNGSNGIRSEGGNTVVLLSNVNVAGNATGLSGTNILSFGNNHVAGNNTDGTPTGPLTPK